ncbi:MAG: DNA recombination protein RmuC [Treponema sp.]|nr:DNA recombination protein RmuC [Treponema sp.]
MDFHLFTGLAILVIVIAQLIAVIVLLSRNKEGSQERVLQKLIEYDTRLDKSETNIRNDLELKFGQNRADLTTSLKSASDQLSTTITNFTGLVDNKIKSISDSLDVSSRSNREELAASLKLFEEKSSAKIEALTKDTKEGLEKNRDTVEKKLAEIQEGNEKKLEKMRETVDEKLQKTLEARLGESFKLVSERLELVQKGLGEMQNLASDVGDLKKVMSNVKTKGVLGEYQLEAILEQMLNPGQYEKNVKTKTGSDKYVEFAIKIPSKEDSGKTVWLPIDAKLPASDYEALVDAYDTGDKKAVDDARKAFSRTVKNFAKEIYEKYVDSPNTTDFAIMFLPFEGAYAEVVRDPALFESIQREHKIIVTGPSTIAAFLNALQVGFKSLAVEKGTSVILNTLSAIKKEFGNFETILAKVKEQIDKASTTLDETVGKRTKAINRALKRVETLPDDAAGQKLLAEASSDLDELD